MVFNTLVRLSRSTLKENAMKDFLLSVTMIKRVFMVAESIFLLILQLEVVSGEQKKLLQNFGAQFMLLSTIILKRFINPEYKKRINNVCKDGMKKGGNVPEGDVNFRPTQ